jgi:tripartite-type tricarboxylate transporter receptor subunit TctC
MTRHRALVLAATILALMWAAPGAARAQSAEEFYRSRKELNLITSGAAGGGYDGYSRLVARHMSKYLPGNPLIVVNNMPGSGGIRAANMLYSVAPRDGSVFCLIDRGMPTAPLLYGERSKAQFDAVKFTWIGSIMRETGMGVLSTRSPIRTVADGKIHSAFFGATGPETDPAMYVRLVNDLVGTRFKVINGYKGQPEEFLAVAKGELDGLFMSGWSGPGKAYVGEEMAKGQLRLLVQMAAEKDPQHADIPTILDLVTAPEDRQIVELVLNRMALGRPLIAPPELPADRTAILRTAFRRAAEDPEFRAEAQRQRLALDPMYGEEAQDLIRRLYAAPPKVVERTRAIVGMTE